MIEKTILDYLSGNLEVPVYMEQPEEKDESFVILEKTGSSRENYISQSTFAVQSYAPTLFEAAELNEEVKRLMDDIVCLSGISSSRLNSDYNYTDTTTKSYRYQAVYDLVHY